MRKFFLALTTAVAMMTVGLAEPVRLVKYDKETKTVTVKGPKKTDTEEKEYKLTDKVKFMRGEKELPAAGVFKMMASEKAPKQFDITLDKDGKLEVIKFGKGKKADK